MWTGWASLKQGGRVLGEQVEVHFYILPLEATQRHLSQALLVKAVTKEKEHRLSCSIDAELGSHHKKSL